MTKATVLNVDDDEDLQIVVGQYLESDGYRVLKAISGKELEDRLQANDSADVILLDLVLPDAEGFNLIAKIRSKSKAPIIIVSGKSDTTEKVVGLEMGADDYITKPFEMRELSARIKAVLRRASERANDLAAPGDAPQADQITFSGWRLDRTQYQLFDAKNRSADLTTGEFKLLEALVLSANRVLSREHLFEITRGGDFDAFDRAIDIQIGRIRKKIKDDVKSGEIIKTVRGVGYMFCGKTES